MNLPILGTLSTLFTDVNSELKKLFDPWSLISAGIFVALALAFVYVPLQPDDALIKAWKGWSTTVQLAVATLLLFSLAYLINTLGGTFLALASGRFLRGSTLGEAFKKRQKRTFVKLLAQSTAEGDDDAAARAFYRLAYEFPAVDELAPTRLGNVRASVAAYSLNQYGAHLDTVWPLLAQTLANKEDEKLLEQVRAEQTATTMLATLSVLLVVVGVAAVSLALAQAALWRLVFALALLPLAYGLYRAAVVRALGWGRLIRAALDLHLDETGTKLGLQSLAGDPPAARERWEAVSGWLAYGGMKQTNAPKAEAGWYEKSAATSPTTLTCSANVVASVRVTELPRVPFVPSSTDGVPKLLPRTYEFIVLATYVTEPDVHASAPSNAGAFIMVSDKRLPFLPAEVKGKLHRPNDTQIDVEAVVSRDLAGPDALLWRLPDLAAHGSEMLRYTAAVESKLAIGTGVERADWWLPARDRSNKITVELRRKEGSRDPLTLYAEQVTEASVGESFLWAPLTDARPGEAKVSEVKYDREKRCAEWRIPDESLNRAILTLTLSKHSLEMLKLHDDLGQLGDAKAADVEKIIQMWAEVDRVLTAMGDEEAEADVVAPARCECLPVKNVPQFPAGDNDCENKDKANKMVILYDYLSREPTRIEALTPRQMNNIACYLLWQTNAEDAKSIRALLQKALDKNPGNDLKEQIEANRDRFTPAGGPKVPRGVISFFQPPAHEILDEAVPTPEPPQS